ncbi:MAG TPA: dihydrolipoyl dehydrogenase [Gemmataceae bacterium]|nr:dihydrolipoyl dehydrogenase [Gemmataceae bacterium]
MPNVIENNLIILGGGPGGYAAAFLAADKGMKVTLIDASARPGGTCLFVGCIPSKALLHSAKMITDARDAAQFGIQFGPPKIDVNGVRGHWQKVVDGLSKNLFELCKRRKVEFVQSRVTFLDSQSLQLADGSQRRFKHCILATGSVPVRPGPLGIKSPRVMDSTGALKLEDVPASLLVVGGGYIGLELGYVYAALGSKVTVVEILDGLLPGVDRELVLPLHKRLEKLFDKIYLNTKVANLEDTGKGVRATFEGEDVKDEQAAFDRVLVAVGRKPNSAELGLEKTGAKLDARGFVEVDEMRRTADERIYAIGDVAGEPMLAHKAVHEGRIAVEAIAGEPAAYDFRAVPAVVFTDPEVAWCGLTESDAKTQKREVKIARFPWGASGRAATLGRQEGLTKLVVDPETEIVLGVGIVGTEAGEMISEGCLAVEMGATASDLSLTMHPHPTLSETVGEAAESLHGTATHLYRPKKS